MAKYEIMLVVNGEIDEQAAKKTYDEVSSTLQLKEIELKNLGLKDLAYEINKTRRGYYFQLNFETNNSDSLREFSRVARINKNVLRHLIINLEKDYGYRAINNAKKVARNVKRAQIHERIQEEMRRRAEERLNA